MLHKTTACDRLAQPQVELWCDLLREISPASKPGSRRWAGAARSRKSRLGGPKRQPKSLGCRYRTGRIRSAPMGPRGGVVTQRSAKPCTPVQFWSWPPFSGHRDAVGGIARSTCALERRSAVRAEVNEETRRRELREGNPTRELYLSPQRRNNRRRAGSRNQQAAFQPSGNGISGHAN